MPPPHAVLGVDADTVAVFVTVAGCVAASSVSAAAFAAREAFMEWKDAAKAVKRASDAITDGLPPTLDSVTGAASGITEKLPAFDSVRDAADTVTHVCNDTLPPAITSVTAAAESVRGVTQNIHDAPGHVGRGVVAGARGVGGAVGGAVGGVAGAARNTQQALFSLLQKKEQMLDEKEKSLKREKEELDEALRREREILDDLYAVPRRNGEALPLVAKASEKMDDDDDEWMDNNSMLKNGEQEKETKL